MRLVNSDDSKLKKLTKELSQIFWRQIGELARGLIYERPLSDKEMAQTMAVLKNGLF